MLHTVQINNEFDIKELSKGKSREKVNLKNRSEKVIESGRFFSSEEFRKRAIEKVNKFCDKHGIL